MSRSRDRELMRLAACLQEKSASGMVTCLKRIKRDSKRLKAFLDTRSYFLVAVLEIPNTKVLDTTLGILADACLQSDIRHGIKETNIASSVVRILTESYSSRTLHCRACRLAGNLSMSSTLAKSLCDAGAIKVLTNILLSNARAQTQCMAVRAVKNIWSIRDDSREEILTSNTIKAITELLVLSKKKLIERENDMKYVDLADACLKAMCVFIDITDLRTGEQMRSDAGLHGYRCIIEYCKINNKLAIKCLYKLSRIAERRPDLGNAGAIQYLLEAVRERQENHPWESLESLCLYSSEAINRAKIRDDSGLETFLALLNEVKNERYHAMLLETLAQFKYDELSIPIMLKNGLVDMLVEKLKKMILDTRALDASQKLNSMLIDTSTTETIEHKRMVGMFAKKRSADIPASIYSGQRKYIRNSSYQYAACSPSGTSDAHSSPSSSSPPHDEDWDIDDNTEDNYSPTCSDNEEIDQSLTNSDDENPNNDTMYLEESLDTNGHDWTLGLLRMLTHLPVPTEKLADPATIRPLVTYIAIAKNHRACGILTAIIRKHAYFIPLLLQGFVFEAQTLYGTEQYTRALCDMAETGGAFGQLAWILLRGRESEKFIVAISIPYLIKSREKLRLLLTSHGGMNLIFHVLNEPDNSLYDDAILGICSLADSLGLEIPETSSYANREFEMKDEAKDFDDTVTFELDDGSTVDANRTSLCDKYDVFKAMLDGEFNESRQNRVRLKKATKEGMTTLLSAVRGFPNVNGESTIEALLEATLLADRFLMCDVSERLNEASIAELNHPNLSRAWTWAKKNSCDEFKTGCAKIFLRAETTRDLRLQTFRDFSKLSNFHEFITDVRQILVDSLYPSRN